MRQKFFGAENSLYQKDSPNFFFRPRQRNYNEDENSDKLKNLWIFRAAIVVTLAIFFSRLFFLTIIRGEENRNLADENRIRLVGIEAERGRILDRNGKVLAESKRTYNLIKDGREREITRGEAADLEKRGLASENFSGEAGGIKSEVKRIYPLGDAAAHVLGYISIIQKEDLLKNPSLANIDHLGRLGIEDSYNSFLMGKNGKQVLEVDSVGRKVSIIGQEEPKIGKDIVSTIDFDLSGKSFEVLKNHAEKSSKKGALVIANPQSGEILALSSYPSFDPTDIGKAVGEAEKPFFNRATQGEYPPGSVFKIVTALAGLEAKAIDKNTEIEDVGEFYIGAFRFPNWYFVQYGSRDGVLKVDRAIARSNDIFFYRTAEKTGLEPLRQMAIKFGFGQKTGVDLSGEGLGLVPSEVWKQSVNGEGWFLGDTMHLGIGQGFMVTTPVQVNVMTAFMASGRKMKPFVVSKVDGSSVETKEVSAKFVTDENFDLVRDGMRQACEKGGTGWPFFEAKYKVGCKTGTAEKGLGNPHAWFTAFAPYDNPQVAITVIIEDGGEGSSVAGPVAKEILDFYFQNKK